MSNVRSLCSAPRCKTHPRSAVVSPRASGAQLPSCSASLPSWLSHWWSHTAQAGFHHHSKRVRSSVPQAGALVRWCIPVPRRPKTSTEKPQHMQMPIGNMLGAFSKSRHARGGWHKACLRCTALPSRYRRLQIRAKLQQAPNPSIERTSQRPLRALCAAAHVER